MGQERAHSDSDANTAADKSKVQNNGNDKRKENSVGTGTTKLESKGKSYNPKNDDIISDPLNNSNESSSAVLCTESNSGTTELPVVPNIRNEFKLRVVPLEKLLENPRFKVATENNKKLEQQPQRRSRNSCTLIELSDSEESDETGKVNNKLVSNAITATKIKENAPKLAKRLDQLNNSDKSENLPKSDKQVQQIRNEQQSQSLLQPQPQPQQQIHRMRPCTVRLKRTPIPVIRTLTLPSSIYAAKRTVAKVNGGESFNSSNRSSRLMALEAEKPVSSHASRRKMVQSDTDDSDYNVEINEQNASGMDSDAKSSDSEVIPTRKKRVFNKRKKSSSDDSDFMPKPVAKKRSRIKRGKESSDDGDSYDGKKKKASKSDDEDGDEKNKNKRKHIRKILKSKDLDVSTLHATKEEEERRKRIEERQRIYNQIYEKPENVAMTELVLDFEPETKEPLLEVDKSLLKKLKPHQVAGVKFMWDACFETLKEAEEKSGSGCILAHCMGLGKTLQVVALSHTLLVNSSRTGVERVLIITPLSTLSNWAREFHYWISFARKRDVEVYDMSKYKDKPMRIFKLNEWFEEGGVCIIGYDMYRILANEKAKGLRKVQREKLQKSLVDPGPDLVVCDEGHLLKNEKTSISKAVTQMRTKRRIVLTGTPLQNNLKEYYCMIQFIKPNLLGTYKEYLNRFVNPISNGQYTDSTDRDIRLMKHRSHILHKMLEGSIQRRDYSVLAPYLPPKNEYVVYTTLSDLQQQLYEYYMTTQRDIISSDIGGKGARLFQDFQDLRRIWTHPMNLRMNSDIVIRKRQRAEDSDSMDDFVCDDDEEGENSSSSESSADSSKSFASGAGSTNAKGGSKVPRTRQNKDTVADSDIEEVTPQKLEDDPSEWWKRFVEEKELNNINHSPKLVVLMDLLQECEAIGDKLLVFSQSLQSLDVIEHFLSLIDLKTKELDYEGDVGDFKGIWKPGVDYFRLDGSCSVESREAMCKKFNDVLNLRARLFLISTRAGGLGINLVAANRVVIFDVSWNPSHDTQSIFRVYRFGQEKPCYIYRLIAMGTMEQKVYERQVAKQATAKRVIDEQQISRHYNQSDLQELYTYELKISEKRELPNLPKDRLFAELLSKHEKWLFKYHEHDSLLENEESENLSEEDRKAAWTEYEAEKTRTTQTAQYMSYDRGAYGGQFGNASGSVTSNRIFGFRSDVLLQLLNMQIAKDHPELSQNQVIQLVPSYLQQLYAQMNSNDPSMYKDLLSLHATIIHPSGMYINPLLYANQNPNAAGYFQQPVDSQGQPAPPPESVAAPSGFAQPVQPVTNFNSNEVYEID